MCTPVSTRSHDVRVRMTSSEQPAQEPPTTDAESSPAPQVDPDQQPAKKQGDPLLDEAGAGRPPEGAERSTGPAPD